ncbi:CPBP family intramembrane glutamic endopeptidase [Paenibacillus ferrarius]
MKLFNIPIIPVSAVLFAPILEELIFRKIIFGTLDKRCNFWIGSIISSMLFAAAHLSIQLFLGYFAVGMVFCWFYKKSNSLIVTVLAHTYINFLVIISKSIIT